MSRRLIVLFIFIFPKILFGQDPGFSQFFANPLYLNPAFTGTTELPRAVINYRNQWPQKGATFTTYSLSYDQPSKKMNALEFGCGTGLLSFALKNYFNEITLIDYSEVMIIVLK